MLGKQYTHLSLVNLRLFLKVYGKDFSLPTRKEKQRNQDLFLVCNFSVRQPHFPTSENVLKFTTISVKVGDRICTSQNQLWFPHFSKHGQSQSCESTEAHFYPCFMDVVMLLHRNGWPCTSASKGIQLLVQRMFFLSQWPARPVSSIWSSLRNTSLAY